jgi:hypothetical protein
MDFVTTSCHDTGTILPILPILPLARSWIGRIMILARSWIGRDPTSVYGP